MKIVKRIYRISAVILLPVAGAALFADRDRFLLSIVVGGVLALVNLRGLAKSVKGLLGAERAAGKMVALSFIRLGALFAVLFALFKFRAVNGIGVLLGFTVIFTVILAAGFVEAKTGGGEGDIISP